MNQALRVALCVLLSSFSSTVVAQLSGTYTIGGTSPNYSTIGAAVSAIDNLGVNGAVTFNIRQGTYAEQVSINQILGASATNTITFQSDPSNTQNPIIQHTSIGSATSQNFVWRFNGADYIRLNNLTVKSLSTTYSTVISFQGAALRNKITHCKIIGNSSASTSNAEYTITNGTGSSNMCSYNEISNCEIQGGSYGLYLRGNTINSREDSNLVVDNKIYDYGWKAVHAEFQSNLVVRNNELITQKNPTYTALLDLYFNYCYALRVHQNKILHYATNGRGMELRFCNALSSSSTKVTNNFISMLGNSTLYGLYSYRCRSNEYYYNSIYIKGNSNSSGIVFDASTSSSSVGQIYTKNNCIQMVTGNPIEYKSGTFYLTYTTELNYNNYFTGGTIKIKYYNNNYTSISSWANATNKDRNTIQTNPYYYSETDLHTNAAGLNGKAQRITGFTTDIDGETRANSPDIGADEFNTAALDAGMSTVITDYCPGVDTAKVVIRNNGSTTVTSLKLGWDIRYNNGTYVHKDTLSWSGSMTAGQTQTVSLGTLNFPKDSTIELRVYCYNPNNGTDGIKNNDTIQSGSITTQMSGIYTVGGTNPSFSTPLEALNAMKAVGICGPVTLHVRQGTYSGELNLTAISGSSAANRITIKADPNNTAEAILTHSNQTIKINGGNYFTIEGLTIQGTGNHNRVYWANVSTGIELIGNKIIGANINNTSANYAVIRNDGRRQNNAVIKDNEIQYGSYGIYFYGVSNLTGKGLTIENNDIKDFYNYGSYVYYNDEVTLKNNKLTHKNVNTTIYGAYFRYCDNIKEVSNNEFSTSSTTTSYGFYFQDCVNSSSVGLVYNNMLSFLAAGSANQFGLYFRTSSFLITAYNSIRISANTQNSYAAYYSGGSNHRFYNNNLFAAKGYTLYTNSTTNITHCDYNNYYSGGNSFAYWATASQSLSDLITRSGGKNANCLQVENGFLSSTNLRSNKDSLNNSGTPTFGITTDIDGKTRSSSTPDIGCNEFDAAKNNAGISSIISSYCPGSPKIMVRLINAGTDTLKSVKIHSSVKINTNNFTNQPVVNWVGSLPPNSDTLVELNSSTFFTGNSYQVKAYTSLPNSVTDSVSDNDTLTAAITLTSPISVTMNPILNACVNSPSVGLSGTPSGGTFNGTGVYSSTFYPDSAGLGNHRITYQYTDTNGCSNTASDTVTVRNKPTVSLGSFSDICLNASSINLTGGSPVGGTYYVENNSTTAFNPSSSTVGTKTVKYVYSDNFGCTDSATNSITVLSLPNTSLTLSPICADSVHTLVGGAPSGGTYSGTGVSNGVFNATTTGAGSQQIIYTVQAANGCSASDTTNLLVRALPTISFGPLPDVCTGSAQINLSATPNGGTFLGTGVSNNKFNPGAVTIGSYTLTYRYTDQFGCSNSDTASQTVLSAPTTSLSNFADVCVNSDSLILNNGTPANGIYSGNGVLNGVFYPSVAGIGNHTIKYKVTLSGGCSDSTSKNITVDTIPAVSLNLSPICSDSMLTLSSGLPLGGTYSGTNVSNGVFNGVAAGAGNTTIVYTFMDANGCTSSASDTQIVRALPNVSFSPLSAVCEKGSSVTLSGGSPAPGVYSGQGVLNGVFQTSTSSPGNYVITYSFTDQFGCSNEDTSIQVINALPNVSLSALTSVCDSSGNISFNQGTPSGGTYFGNFIANNLFSSNAATVGKHLVTYSYTDNNTCQNSDTASIEVLAKPMVSFASLNPVCDSSATVSLSGGLPTGGVYSGPFVNSGSFDPKAATVGSHSLKYEVTNQNNCTDSATQTLQVNALPNVSHNSVSDACVEDTSFTLSGGTPSNGSYSGTGISGNIFSPKSAGVGTKSIWYKVTNSNQCTDSTSFTIVVNPNPIVSVASINNVCENADSLTLTGSTPLGGTYSGNGIYGSKLYVNGLNGNQQVFYSVTNSFNCSSTDTANYLVYQAPTVNFAALSDVCSDTGSIRLSGGTPMNGVYTGISVNAGRFNATAAGTGTFPITYTFTNSNNCVDSASQRITVHALPTVQLTLPDSLCLNSTLKLRSGNPIGGVYSGAYVSNGVLTPNTPRYYKVTYVYTDTNSCTNSITDSTYGQPWTNINFASIPEVCIGSVDSIVLNQAVPAGGIYYGKNTNSFASKHSVTQVKSDTVWYKYSNAACIDSAFQIATVNPLPTVSMVNDTVCENTPAFTLNSGFPVGGNYRGQNVSNTKYTPTPVVGMIDTVFYDFTDANGCFNTATALFVLNPTPLVSINSLDSICSSDTFSLVGSPIGGLFSGTGVNGSQLNPYFDGSIATIGLNSISYSFTDGLTECTDSIGKDIYVAQLPVFDLGNDTGFCGNTLLALDTKLPILDYRFEWNSGENTPDLSIGQAGEYSVVVFNANLKRCVSADTIRIDYEEICSGLAEEAGLNFISVYPNPAKDVVFIDFEVPINNIEFQLFDTQGKSIHSIESTSKNDHLIEINTSTLLGGVYFLNLVSDNNSKTIRLVISR